MFSTTIVCVRRSGSPSCGGASSGNLHWSGLFVNLAKLKYGTRPAAFVIFILVLPFSVTGGAIVSVEKSKSPKNGWRCMDKYLVWRLLKSWLRN